MYLYWSADPNSLKIQASAFSSTFRASNQRYFSIENIEFNGSILTNISIMESDHFEMKNNTISESGTDAVNFGICSSINYNKNKINNTNNNALTFAFCKNIVASNNEIHNTGLRAGMGGDNYMGVSMYNQVKNCLFEYNLIDSIGYDGVYFAGDSIIIRNNVITNFCMIIDDGGGLYTGGSDNSQHVKRELENNIVLNGVGAGEGTDNPTYTAAEGIYIDDHTNSIKIINNTVANCNNGIHIHNSHDISIIGNTLYSNNIQLGFYHTTAGPTYPITNCTVNNNIFFAKSKSQMVAEFTTIYNGIPNFGTFDNNYYCRPVDDELTIFTKYTGPSGSVSKYMDLETWQTTYQYDLHSKKSPATIPAYNIINYVGSNKIINGKFDNDISGWRYISNNNNCIASWDNSDKLDNGSLKISFSSPTGNADSYLSAFFNFDNVVAGGNYILKFSMFGSNPGKTSKTYMGITVDPYNLIAPAQFINMGTARNEYQFLFTPESFCIKCKNLFSHI